MVNRKTKQKKTKIAVFRMLELTVASTFGGIMSYFITKFYDTGITGYFLGFMAVFPFIAIFGFIFYWFSPIDKD